MAFQKGQSGNPDGRPKNPFRALIKEATEDGKLIVDAVVKVLKSSKKNSEILWACEFLRDTGWHKPITPNANTDTDGNDVIPPIQFVPVTTRAEAEAFRRDSGLSEEQSL